MEEIIKFAIYSALAIGGLATIIYLLDRKIDEGLFEKEKKPLKGEIKKKIFIGFLMIVFWGLLALFPPWNIKELAYLLFGACMIWSLIYFYLQRSNHQKDADKQLNK